MNTKQKRHKSIPVNMHAQRTNCGISGTGSSAFETGKRSCISCTYHIRIAFWGTGDVVAALSRVLTCIIITFREHAVTVAAVEDTSTGCFPQPTLTDMDDVECIVNQCPAIITRCLRSCVEAVAVSAAVNRLADSPPVCIRR